MSAGGNVRTGPEAEEGIFALEIADDVCGDGEDGGGEGRDHGGLGRSEEKSRSSSSTDKKRVRE